MIVSKIQEQFSNLSTKAQENISGIRVVKAFAREESEIDEFGQLNQDYVRRNVSLDSPLGHFLSVDDRLDRPFFRSACSGLADDRSSMGT